VRGRLTVCATIHSSNAELAVNSRIEVAAERFLCRLSRSRHADHFVVKGALLMLVWLGETIRPTRDADLLGFGDLTPESLTRMFADVCATDVEPDGLIFLASSIRVAPIREEDPYGGLRATIQARLGNARLHIVRRPRLPRRCNAPCRPCTLGRVPRI
jgi:hypothetical protein